MEDKITVTFSREELPLLGCLLEKGYIDAPTANPRQELLQKKLAEYGFEVNKYEAIGDRQIRAYLYRRFQIAVSLAEASIPKGSTFAVIDPLSESLDEPTVESATEEVETKPVGIYSELAASILDKETTEVTYKERVVCKSAALGAAYEALVSQEAAEDTLQTALDLPDVESFFD